MSQASPLMKGKDGKDRFAPFVSAVGQSVPLIERFTAKKNLIDGAANPLFNVNLPTLKGTSGFLTYLVFATDGVDVQVRRGTVQYSAVNKGGVFTSEIVIISEGVSVSAGTLTVAWSITTSGDLIIINTTPTGSLTETQLFIIFTLRNDSEQGITLL